MSESKGNRLLHFRVHGVSLRSGVNLMTSHAGSHQTKTHKRFHFLAIYWIVIVFCLLQTTRS